LVRDAVDVKALLTNGADADGEVVWSLCLALFFAVLRMQETVARQGFIQHFRTNKKARQK
jgi:hypothetical protein